MYRNTAKAKDNILALRCCTQCSPETITKKSGRNK